MYIQINFLCSLVKIMVKRLERNNCFYRVVYKFRFVYMSFTTRIQSPICSGKLVKRVPQRFLVKICKSRSQWAFKIIIAHLVFEFTRVWNFIAWRYFHVIWHSAWNHINICHEILVFPISRTLVTRALRYKNQDAKCIVAKAAAGVFVSSEIRSLELFIILHRVGTRKGHTLVYTHGPPAAV